MLLTPPLGPPRGSPIGLALVLDRVTWRRVSETMNYRSGGVLQGRDLEVGRGIPTLEALGQTLSAPEREAVEPEHAIALGQRHKIDPHSTPPARAASRTIRQHLGPNPRATLTG